MVPHRPEISECFAGGAGSAARATRSASRNALTPHARNVIFGFRVAGAPRLGLKEITTTVAHASQPIGPDAAQAVPATRTPDPSKPKPSGPAEPPKLVTNTPKLAKKTAKKRRGPAEPPKSITNSLGMKLALIPAGEFLMGSSNDDNDAEVDEKPQHRVGITRPFYLGTNEVTVGQFRRARRGDGIPDRGREGRQGGRGLERAERRRSTRGPKYTWRNPGFAQSDEHPVVNVSWNDAIAFCDQLSVLEGLTPFKHFSASGPWEGEGYRLPTEAEWEYACRAGTTTRFESSDDPETLPSVGNFADGTAKAKYPGWNWAMTARDGYVYTAPVGRFRPNAFGLSDMHGNVAEYCWDSYNMNYYRQAPEADPLGPFQATSRVIRGGNWHDNGWQGRSANRKPYPPTHRSNCEGFRVVRVPPAR